MAKKSLRRKIARLLKKPKFFKTRVGTIKLQKFSLICFLANAKPSSEKPGFPELFRIAANFASEYFQKFVAWLLCYVSQVAKFSISLLRNNRYFIMFSVGMSVALLIFFKQIVGAKNSILVWLQETFKWPVIGGSIIILLLIYFLMSLISDLPSRILVAKAIQDAMLRMWNFIHRSNKSQAVDYESKFTPERTQFIVFSVATILILRYLLDRYKRKCFDTIPLGNILIEFYKQDMKDLPHRLIHS
jgi:hypothetical protein